MRALWGTKQSSLLGLDLGSSMVRVMELSKYGEQYRVERYAQEAIPDNAVDGKSIKDPGLVIDAIKKVLKRVKCKKVAVAVPDSSVISKVIQLEEGLSDDEAEELVLLEADKYIPFPIDEVSIDYEFLGPSGRGGNLQDVLVVASRTENVNTKVNLLTECGLDVQVVDVESYAIERACSLIKSDLIDGGENKTIAIFDIGELYTQLIVLHDLKVIFSREEVFGGQQLTNDIMKYYDIPLEEAKQAKSSGSLPDDYEEEVLEPFREMVSIQIRRALQFFYSTSQYSEVDQILLTGGTSLINKLEEKIEEVIGTPTARISPLSKLDLSRHVDREDIEQSASTLMIVCGLAMRKFE